MAAICIAYYKILLDYDMTIDPKQSKAYAEWLGEQSQRGPAPTVSESGNGKTYLKAGTYTLTFRLGEQSAETTLVLK